MNSQHQNPFSRTDLLLEAKEGGVAALGNLLNQYGNYLKLLAQSQLDPRLRRRVSPSDLVQETMLEAHRDFPQFRGTTLAELIGWLRRILINNLIRTAERHLDAEKRDIRREVSLEQVGSSLEKSHVRFECLAADKLGSPSSQVCRVEQLRLLSDAIAELPAEQRQVVVMRHVDGLQFNEIAANIEKTSGACRMIWLRAMDALRNKLDVRGAI